MIQNAAQANRIVVKVGTSTLAHKTGLMNIQRMERLVKVLADLKNSGKEIILVSSGAIGVGVGKMGLKEKPTDTPAKQACAAIGQCELMYCYDKYFSEYNHSVAQVLLTRDIIDSPERKQNVVNTFQNLLRYGVVPVVNENDTVAVEEIVFGDNDTLSAIVGSLVGADLLIILSDIDGVFDQNPRVNPNAKLIPHIPEITDSIRALAGDHGTSLGTGGMVTKITAAQIGLNAGFPTVILNGSRPENLYDLLDGKQVGTYIG
ncbi:MAG TPA: glutamate 5-kinase [Candidatus Merdivicinus excrementipullorum]|uniref:Glutamate 5-kinase n=1 Tax=Candidatus Merdivicinus excrementipullorum TaxID=2840867 RepID=A0A9D1JZ56_9FIRM|nr:glutamate 5-kinase [Candidatus Merdivicinus excrementipullorum]